MKRTLLVFVVVAGFAALVGGAVKQERIKILKAKVLRITIPARVPNQGDKPFTRDDVVFIGVP